MKNATYRIGAPAAVTTFALTLVSTEALAGRGHGGGHGGGHGHGVPAPEIGASAIGMLLAAGIAIYAKRRGKNS